MLRFALVLCIEVLTIYCISFFKYIFLAILCTLSTLTLPSYNYINTYIYCGTFKHF